MSIAFNKVKTALGMDDVLPFGKHQGYTVLEILKDRPEYIAWLMENTSLKFYQSVHDEVNRVALSVINAYKPRRKMYQYDHRYEDALDALVDDWDNDVPW